MRIDRETNRHVGHDGVERLRSRLYIQDAPGKKCLDDVLQYHGSRLRAAMTAAGYAIESEELARDDFHCHALLVITFVQDFGP